MLFCLTVAHRFGYTKYNLRKNARNVQRRLEIGPGVERIAGFETLNVVAGRNVDYVADATKKLPFSDNTFDLVYASHILEHVPWYQTRDVLNEWIRTIKPGGRIEIWVPNGLLICKTFVEAETGVDDQIEQDGWYKFNDSKDPCLWASGRVFSYGGGDGKKNHPNWHMAIFSPRYLQSLLEALGLVNVTQLANRSVRGYDHGWINLGFSGTKQ
jgi:SAM-dependent methyltransferase